MSTQEELLAAFKEDVGMTPEEDDGTEVLVVYELGMTDKGRTWVCAMYDEDNGAYAIVWHGDDWGMPFYEAGGPDALRLFAAAKAAAHGYYCAKKGD